MKKPTMIVLCAGLLGAALLTAHGKETPSAGGKAAGLQKPVEVQINNFYGKPHYEILIMNRNAEGPGGTGNYYNSLGIIFDEPDDIMDARFRALNPEKLKKEYGGDGVRFNGPRRFLVNRVTGLAWDGGKKFMMGQIPTYLYGVFDAPNYEAFMTGEQKPYHETVSRRTSTFHYTAGQTVHELVTPEGHVYTMFSLSLRVDPSNTIENLPTLKDRLTLPQGWTFRTRILKEDEIVVATVDSDPPNTIVLDQFENNYNHNRNASAKPAFLNDGADAKTLRVENMHKARYIEMFPAARNAKTGEIVAACYNTMFTPKGIPDSRDTAPQALVQGLDLEKLKEEYGLVGVTLNGPKLWMPDWAEVEAGKIRDFNGLKAAWVAEMHLGDKTTINEGGPYKPAVINRKSLVGWNKGTTVLLLDDAEGNTYVMKGFQLGLKPQHTFDAFVAAGEANFKKLPEGWKFRVVTLEKDLIENPEGGIATIMADEFFNVYDKTGSGMTNYKP